MDAEDKLYDDRAAIVIVTESETRDIIVEMLNNHENHAQVEQVPIKVEPFVEFNGNRIFKSKLVGQLNGNPFMLKDRIICVKNSLYFNKNEDYLNVAQCSNT